LIREEIETMWNEPAAGLKLHHSIFTIVFRIQASHDPAISPIDIFQNLDPGIIISALKSLHMEIFHLLMD
jgi:hypothetical protein